MFNPEQLLGQLLKSGLSGGLGLGKKKKRGGSLLGSMSTGTKAQLGMGIIGVAIAAYEHYSKQNASAGSTSSTPRVTREPELPKAEASASIPPSDAALMVQAMVAAAAADGVIDDSERAQMLKRAADAGFDDETKRFLEQELNQPKSLAVIASSARPEIAADLYAASCAAITADTDAERVYLDTLAKRLALTQEVRSEIHRQLDMA